MKRKFYLSIIFICLLCSNVFAQGSLISQEQMPIQTDFGAVILNADGSEQTVYPATMTLGDLGGSQEGSQWCDVAIWLSPFSIADYPGFRVRLQRGYGEDGVVQLFARNAYSASNYAGPYIPFKANQVELEGEFSEYDTQGYFDDDPVCVWFAIQYTQKGKEKLMVREVALIDEDGEEVLSHNIRNDSWRPSPDWVDPDPVYDANVKISSRGTIGLYKSDVSKNQAHCYTFKFAEPVPAGFKFKVMLTIDYDFDVYTYDVPAGVTEWTSPAITEDYRAAFLEFKSKTYPHTVHVTGVTRDIFDTAGIESMLVEKGIKSRNYYTVDGMQQPELGKGLNIVREIMTDGSVRTKKIMK